MKARSLYLGLQCAQWNINYLSPMSTCLAVHGLRVLLICGSDTFGFTEEKSLACFSGECEARSCSAYCCYPQTPKIHLVMPDWGPWCNIMQPIAKLKTEILWWIFICHLESYYFFLCLRLQRKTDGLPRMGQWGEKGEMERRAVCVWGLTGKYPVM